MDFAECNLLASLLANGLAGCGGMPHPAPRSGFAGVPVRVFRCLQVSSFEFSGVCRCPRSSFQVFAGVAKSLFRIFRCLQVPSREFIILLMDSAPDT